MLCFLFIANHFFTQQIHFLWSFGLYTGGGEVLTKIVLEGKTMLLNKKYNLKVSVCFTCLQIHVTWIDHLTCL